MNLLDILMLAASVDDEAIEAAKDAAKPKKLALVYRVEDEDGFGPYHSRRNHDFSEQLILEHNDSEKHPATSQVALLLPGEHRVGMPTLKSLRNWFTGWLDRLAQHSYNIALYEVEQYTTYKGQVVFNPYNARRLWAKPIKELL